MSVAAAPVLAVEGLTADYAGNRALTVARLALSEGELLGVVGANGAGKSTLVGAILGWSRGAPRYAGSVTLDGEEIAGLGTPKRVRRGLLLIPESRLIFGTMTVADNLAHAASTNDAGGRRIYSLDEIYDLFPNLAKRRGHLGSQLSGGERQMLGIARALRLAPRVLLLDEPSIGLAPKLVHTVLATIRALADDGLTVLLIEQNVMAAIEVVDRVALLERGRVVAEGTAAAMRTDHRIAEAYLGGAAA
ncbi:ABC transporter ATP-binding protein [Acuticoccus sp. I52.16.1]|uniref:ABC transporter ATP-binding protein n=1 Tax=Acuticoccus sp. I52.16.1 TaxID=2928472 RepID=UPI001FD51142|nr:ABC transporter ATP-binding protein [Acuticoccus sp. I52.16.1]UOM32640.1 ABC transporter ATP-binding protein [Acuticoccus sp. I52.16.1]